MVWFGIIGMVWYRIGMVWNGMLWCMDWYSVVWLQMVSCLSANHLFVSTNHHCHRPTKDYHQGSVVPAPVPLLYSSSNADLFSDPDQPPAPPSHPLPAWHSPDQRATAPAQHWHREAIRIGEDQLSACHLAWTHHLPNNTTIPNPLSQTFGKRWHVAAIFQPF